MQRFIVIGFVCCVGCRTETVIPYDPDGGVSTTNDGGRTNSTDGGSGDGGSTATDGGTSAGTDAGTFTDGGVDAGPGADGGLLPDGGISLDGGTTTPDAGPPPFPWTPAPPPPATGWLTSPPVCSDSAWLAKYMNYRRRLRGNNTAQFPGFLHIGSGAGMSMVAGLRNPAGSCTNHWLTNACGKDPIPNADGFYLWGDGVVWHGWYLQTLATEYAAFKQLGIDTAETESDLAYALEAFNRLDEAAELVFSLPGARDGFFIRDDVSPSFHILDTVARTPRFPRSGGGLTGYGCIASTTSCGPVTAANGSFMSQDQFIEMLVGMALIAKLVPPTVTVRGVPLAQEAKNIVDRVVNYLKRNDWLIKDPLGNQPPNQWGGSARSYSYPIAKSAQRITGTNYEDGWTALNFATWTAADLSWPGQTLNNQSMILPLGTLVDDTQLGGWSMSKLVTRSRDWDSPNMPMARAVLDGQGLPPGISAAQIEAILTSAPCGGPCYAVPGCTETPGWMGEHRFKSPEKREGDALTGEYAGIDYMLLHNLSILTAGRHELVWPAPATTCAAPAPLDTFTTTGAPVGTTFDPWNSCDARSFGATFCGRSFASWLDASYAKTATIFVSGGILQCDGHLPCVVVAASMTGTPGDDLFLGSGNGETFEGGDGVDCLYGFGGNDNLKGRGGADEIHGGTGNDTICGEGCLFTELNGDGDMLYGEDGDDTMNGGPGIDAMYGGAGNDELKGDQAQDTLYGGDGNDRLEGEFGDDRLWGGPGNDTLIGGVGEDKLGGGDGRDKLDGQDGDDQLFGGAGDDFLMGGAGADSLWGDDGADRMCGGCGDDALRGGWDAASNSCRGQRSGLFCLGSDNNTLEQCQTSASSGECDDAAFNAW